MYSDEFLSQIRDACPIETVAADYVPLKRRGRTYVCSCPFHSEKTPSCTIFPDTQSFYCFGCGAGGDVITWIRRIENLDFSEAVKFLAEKSGLEIPSDPEADRKAHLRTQILAINRESANFYYKNLVSGPDKRGLQYFKFRQIKPETIQKYGLGFSSDHWDDLTRFLLNKGFTEEELLTADVAHRSDRTGKLYDTFRNRVMFPIVDTKGSVIGFGGRVMDDSHPKYLNSAQTPVFDKGRNLFSLNFAKDSSSTQLILTEGYMDVIAMNQAGFSNVIATLGTAITPQQARIISQYAKEVILSYDNDVAGQTATQRAINRFSEVGLPVRVLHMDGTGVKDPDEYIKKYGADRFRMLLDKAGDAVNFQLDKCEEGLDVETESGRVQLLKRVIPILAEIENPIEREVYISRTASKWDISADVLRTQVESQLHKTQRAQKDKNWNRVYQQTVHPNTNPHGEKSEADLRRLHAEERIIVYILTFPQDSAWIAQDLMPEQFSTPLYQQVFTIFQQNTPTFTTSSLGGYLSTEEMGKITGLQTKYHDVSVTKEEVKACMRIVQEPQDKPIETDADLLSLIQQKQSNQTNSSY